jgi:prefoldin alpha subunit
LGHTYTVDLSTLSAQQLSAVKKQLDGEVEHLTSSYAQLAAAQSKFKECLRIVKSGSASFESTFVCLFVCLFACLFCSFNLPLPLFHQSLSSLSYTHTHTHTHTHTPTQLLTDHIIYLPPRLAEDKQVLVPLTNSLYVKGKLSDPDRVLVDVGTGFYVEKSTASAAEFYESKIKELQANIQGLEGIVQAKTNNLRVVEEVLRQKVLAAQQQQGPAAAGAAASASGAQAS